MRARYYSPLLKRFINEDVVTGDISNSNSLNRYAYVEGNPASMIDPFGLCAEKAGSTIMNALEDENVQKVLIGTGFIIVGAGMVVLSGGTATPILIAMGAGVAGTTAAGAVIGYCENGTQGAIDGACTGYEIGGMLSPLVAMGGLALEAKLTADLATAYGGTSLVEEAQLVAQEYQEVTPGFEEWLNKGESDNLVYKAVSNAGVDCYTGITKQALGDRCAQHQNVKRCVQELIPVVENLTRNQARAIEQYYIENGPNILNKINSISKEHRFYSDAMEWAINYIESNGLPK